VLLMVFGDGVWFIWDCCFGILCLLCCDGGYLIGFCFGVFVSIV